MPASTSARLNADPERFSKDGYCVFPAVLTPAEIADTRRVLEKLMADNPATRPEWLTEPHVKNPFLLELCRHPKIVSAVKSILGGNVALIMSHLIVKPPLDGKSVSWHQDRPSWASVKGTDIVTVWLAIDDADTENGCMKVIPSSQEGFPEMEKVLSKDESLFNFKVNVSPELERMAVPIELSAGDISVHDSYILHSSDKNSSPRRRAGYTMRYANAQTVRVDVDKHFAPVYLLSGEAGAGIARCVNLR